MVNFFKNLWTHIAFSSNIPFGTRRDDILHHDTSGLSGMRNDLMSRTASKKEVAVGCRVG